MKKILEILFITTLFGMSALASAAQPSGEVHADQGKILVGELSMDDNSRLDAPLALNRQIVILGFAQEYAEKTALDADTISTKKYPPNVLWSTLEVQGHNQLGLGKWLPGVNDLSGEQISMIDFEKIEFSEFYRQFPEVN